MIKTLTELENWVDDNYSLIDGGSDQDKVRVAYALGVADASIFVRDSGLLRAVAKASSALRFAANNWEWLSDSAVNEWQKIADNLDAIEADGRDYVSNRCREKAQIQCILRDHMPDELAMELADKILDRLRVDKTRNSFLRLLEAAEGFLGWYNRTYQQAPSQHPEHEWCVLSEQIDRIRNATSA